MKKPISQINYKPYLYIGVFFAVFVIMFTVNFLLPIEKTILIPFETLKGRAQKWFELLVTSLAIFCIFKIKKFTKLDLIVSVLLGLIVEFSECLRLVVTKSVFLSLPISAIATATCYYSACQIFRYYNQENKYFNIGIKTLLKSLLIGVVVAIPFSIINAFYGIFVKHHQFENFKFINIFWTASCMLKPGIHEEIICHFFLLAFVTLVFKGVVPKNKFSTFLIYFLCGVPHQILHYPEVFIQNPINGLINTIIVELLLGVPMIWLIRNKNLQTAIAFHWMVDFVSFTSEMI